MNDTTDAPPQLDRTRVEEIRDLLARLVIGPADDDAARELLTECRTAMTELLNDRDDLVRANTEAGEELARWHGSF
jgi:hypothetical protein